MLFCWACSDIGDIPASKEALRKFWPACAPKGDVGIFGKPPDMNDVTLSKN